MKDYTPAQEVRGVIRQQYEFLWRYGREDIQALIQEIAIEIQGLVTGEWSKHIHRAVRGFLRDTGYHLLNIAGKRRYIRTETRQYPVNLTSGRTRCFSEIRRKRV